MMQTQNEEATENVTPPVSKKRRGRPPGSKNKPKSVPIAPVKMPGDAVEQDSEVIITFPDSVVTEVPADVQGFFGALGPLLTTWTNTSPVAYDWECRSQLLTLLHQYA